MRPPRRSVDLLNSLGASNRVIPQPLGVIGIIVPWNFPLHLSLIPLTYAFAAGNRPELAERERAEGEVIATYLPAQLSDDELRDLVTQGVASPGASGPQAIGAVLKAVTRLVAGRADGGGVAAPVTPPPA